MKFTYEPIRPERILAIDPISRGFGFVVLEEEPLQLVDWGVTSCRRAEYECAGLLRRLILRYDPTVLVLEDPAYARRLRQEALIAFMASVGEVLDAVTFSVRLYSRNQIRMTFASNGAIAKEQIAESLAIRFPELRPRLPKSRKPRIWESEDARMSIFDALSLAITHLSVPKEERREAA